MANPVRQLLGVVDADNGVRALWSDNFDWRRALGAVPRRAGRIVVVPAGPMAGLFAVEMEALGPEHAVCLWPPLPSYGEAVAAEERYIELRHVRGKEDADGEREGEAV